MRQFDGAHNGLFQNPHAVMFFEHRGQAAQHQDRGSLVRLVDLDDLKSSRQRRILLEVLLVLGPSRGCNRPQLAPRQCWFEQIGRVRLPGNRAGADHGVSFVDEDDDRRRRGFDLAEHLLEPVFKFASHARTGL